MVLLSQAVWPSGWDARTGKGVRTWRGAGWHEGGAGTVASGQYYQSPMSSANGRIFMIYAGVVRCYEAAKTEN